MEFDYDAWRANQERLDRERKEARRQRVNERLSRIETHKTSVGDVLTIDGFPMRLLTKERVGIERLECVESIVSEVVGVSSMLFSVAGYESPDYACYHPDSVLLFERGRRCPGRVLPFVTEPDRVVGVWNGEHVIDLLKVFVDFAEKFSLDSAQNFEFLTQGYYVALQARRFDEKTHKELRVGMVEARRLVFFIDKKGRGLFVSDPRNVSQYMEERGLYGGCCFITDNIEDTKTMLIVLRSSGSYGYCEKDDSDWVSEFLKKVTTAMSLGMAKHILGGGIV